jgi:hypothetical protein
LTVYSLPSGMASFLAVCKSQLRLKLIGHAVFSRYTRTYSGMRLFFFGFIPHLPVRFAHVALISLPLRPLVNQIIFPGTLYILRRFKTPDKCQRNEQVSMLLSQST